MRPLVSVIIPVKDRASLLYETLESVRSQTYKPLEILVVDDGSQVRQLNRIKNLIGRSENEKLIIQKPLGASSARNRGMYAAAGEQILFLDSDDLLHENAIEMLMQTSSSSYADVVICGTQNFSSDESLDLSEKPYVDSLQNLEPRFFKIFWCTPNALYKRKFLLDMGGWREDLLFGWQDRELCLRIQLMEFTFKVVPKKLIFIRTDATNRLRNIARHKGRAYRESIFNACKDLFILSIANRKYRCGTILFLTMIKWRIALSLRR